MFRLGDHGRVEEAREGVEEEAKGVAEDGSTSREGLISGGNRGSLTPASSFPPFFSLVSSRWRQSPIELNTFPRIVQSTAITADGIYRWW